MPIYDMLEYQMVKRNIPNGWISRLIYRTIYVIIVAFIAITIPFFGSLLVRTFMRLPTPTLVKALKVIIDVNDRQKGMP